jgi:hypothetical protein
LSCEAGISDCKGGVEFLLEDYNRDQSLYVSLWDIHGIDFYIREERPEIDNIALVPPVAAEERRRLRGTW